MSQNAESTQKPLRMPRYTHFGMILYPQENEGHSRILAYLNARRENFPSLYIKHVGEWVDVDESKEFSESEEQDDMIPACVRVTDDGKTQIRQKDHVHVLIKVGKQMTPKGFLGFWGGAVKYVSPIENPEGYVLYMCHKDFKSMGRKTEYDPSELIGDERLKMLAFDKTKILSIIGEYGELSRGGALLTDLVHSTEALPAGQREVYMNTLLANQHLITAINTQEERVRERRRTDGK